MKHSATLTLIILAGLLLSLGVDAKGPAQPAAPSWAYYGTNYTVPFAHAYRALGRLGVDRKEAIDRDVYHMARLGLNAFRLHLWDVELTDSVGNLLANDHLDLLDYLIASVEKRRIAVILTAQTNFGNGYPERNADPNGAYSYRYPKCQVHDRAEAVDAQRRYIAALAAHVNPYTGLSYAADPAILAMEVNNEPCHSGTPAEVTAYIDTMAATLRQAGWQKDILYNVSHNSWATPAYYDARIDGTTYQWYPTGLVSGHTRKGNFLPHLDSYDIPFDTIPGFAAMRRVVYEYDPADVLYTYLYPAAARTFRKAGFEWVTQFAYDPLDMAWANTEYQTHFLNLAYTPGKALGMMIAAEAMRQTAPGADYGKYPTDTIFGPFLVSARRNLAMLNDGVRYYHTAATDVAPRAPERLAALAGVGSSPVVATDGTGAYFLDRLAKGLWRLELMPDVALVADPFAKPSLSRHVAEILPDSITLTISLNELGIDFQVVDIADKSTVACAAAGRVTLAPGAYLLAAPGSKPDAVAADTRYCGGRLAVGEYVAPRPRPDRALTLRHTPLPRIAPGQPLTVSATVIAPTTVDSVVLYPAKANFWNDNNRLYRMTPVGKHEYSVTINNIGKEDCSYDYEIVAYSGGRAVTYPTATPGTPLDWDFPTDMVRQSRYYTTAIRGATEPLTLVNPTPDMDGTELSTIPEAWQGIGYRYAAQAPVERDALRITKEADAPTALLVVSKYVGDLIAAYPELGDGRDRHVCLRLGDCQGVDRLTLGLVNGDGFTYTTTAAAAEVGEVVRFSLADLRLCDTLLNPAPYPVFLSRRFTPDPATATPFALADLSTITIEVEPAPGQPLLLDIAGLWLE